MRSARYAGNRSLRLLKGERPVDHGLHATGCDRSHHGLQSSADPTVTPCRRCGCITIRGSRSWNGRSWRKAVGRHIGCASTHFKSPPCGSPAIANAVAAERALAGYGDHRALVPRRQTRGSRSYHVPRLTQAKKEKAKRGSHGPHVRSRKTLQ
jgi:hypothetical protein